MKKIRAAIYVRVSTSEQNLNGQRKILRDYVARRGWPAPVVFEEKESGAKAARTRLNDLLTDCRHGKFDAVVIYKMDRLGRSLPHLLSIMTELRALKIGVIAMSQGLDTSEENPAADLLFKLLAIFAEFERELIVERTRAGMAHAKRNGRLPGPIRQNEAIARAMQMRSAGMKLAEIAKETGLSISYVSKEFKKVRAAVPDAA